VLRWRGARRGGARVRFRCCAGAGVACRGARRCPAGAVVLLRVRVSATSDDDLRACGATMRRCGVEFDVYGVRAVLGASSTARASSPSTSSSEDDGCSSYTASASSRGARRRGGWCSSRGCRRHGRSTTSCAGRRGRLTFCTARGSAPASSDSVTNVWRKLCGEMRLSIPTLRQSRLTIRSTPRRSMGVLVAEHEQRAARCGPTSLLDRPRRAGASGIVAFLVALLADDADGVVAVVAADVFDRMAQSSPTRSPLRPRMHMMA
jgi:hypothetical protein